MATQARADVVADPVGQISISGVHGRDELNDRLARAASRASDNGDMRHLLIGAAIGAAVMYLLRR